MPLSATRLRDSIRSALLLRSWARDSVELTELCQDIATAVVTEITANAVVPATGIVAPTGGGPCTGATTVT